MKKVVGIVFLVLLIDQILKLYVKSNFHLGEKILDLWILDIQYVENPGMAFGYRLIDGPVGKAILTIFRIFAVIGLLVYVNNLIKKKAHKGYVLAIALVIAGAFGNVIDSLLYGVIFDSGMIWDGQEYLNYYGVSNFTLENGYTSPLFGNVVDMLTFTIKWPSWFPWVGGNEIFPPIFNIADASITIGFFIMIFGQKKFFKS